MSYGTHKVFKTKKALREAVETEGPEAVTVFGTSIFGDETALSVAGLKETDVIVGPNVYQDRRWYANAVRGKDGKIRIK